MTIIPALENGSRPINKYLQILGQFPDVFKEARFYALRDSYDKIIRRYGWFDYSQDQKPILSANLVAAISYHREPEQAAQAQSEARSLIMGEIPSTNILNPKLSAALKPDNRNTSSRIIFRILPRDVIKREFEGEGSPQQNPDLLFTPMRINNSRSIEPDFTDKIVVIGSDFKGNGDYHNTTFGDLSGSYILANSLNMIMTEQIPHESKFFIIVFTALTGIVFSFLYVLFPAVIVTISVFAVSLASPFLSAVIFNRYGIFINVWIPLLGLGLYSAIMDIFGINGTYAKLNMLCKIVLSKKLLTKKV